MLSAAIGLKKYPLLAASLSGANAFGFQSRRAPCRTINSGLRYELLALRPENRSRHRREDRFSRRMPRMRPRASLMPQLRLLRSGLQQQLPRIDGRAGGGQGTIQLLRIFCPERRGRQASSEKNWRAGQAGGSVQEKIMT